MFRNSSNDGCQRWCVLQLVLPGHLVPERVEVDILWRTAVFGCLMILDEGVGDVGAAS